MLALPIPPAPLTVGKRASFSGVAVAARPALPRRRAPRALAQTVSARAATSKATYICVDCGYIYDGSDGPFEKLPNGYRCPVCSAPKRRFKPYAGAAGRNDSKSMNARWQKLQGGEGLEAEAAGSNTGLVAGLVAGAVALGGIYFYLSSVYN